MTKKVLFKLLLLLFSSNVFSQSVQPPSISHESGFYTTDFYVNITHPNPDAVILYTLDGSIPKIENRTGKIYNYKKKYPTNPGDAFGDLLQDTMWTFVHLDSILVRDRSNDLDKIADISTSYYTNDAYLNIAKPDDKNIFKGTVVRVVAYLDGEYSKVLTRNYYVSVKGSNKYTLPVISLNIDADKLYGYEKGLNVPGLKFDEWRSNNLNTVIDRMWAPGNFRAEGSTSELEINFGYMVSGTEVLNHNVGIRNHGNGSRYFPNRSVRLYAKSNYGPSKFIYPFFENYNQNTFKRIILRNSGNDTQQTMFRDAFIQQSVKHLNFDIQEYQPAIVFINSEYNGLYNIRERFDDKYFEDVYGIDINELDFLENDGIVGEGDTEHYNHVMDYLENNSLDDEENYKYVTTLIDPVNFTDYFITEIFISNIDWPTNNNEYWRKKVTYDSSAPYGHDGRWRWILKDLDYSFGYRWDGDIFGFDDLSLVSRINQDYQYNRSTLLFRRLLENGEYQKYFINRFADLLNTTLLPERLNGIINDMASKIAPEMQEFIDRWSPTNQSILSYHPVHNYQTWSENVQILNDFASIRPYYQRNHIRNRFGIERNVNVLVNVTDEDYGYIRINSIDIAKETIGVGNTPYLWSGTYFKNVPIKLKAIAKPGYIFTHWSGEVSDTLAEITLDLDNDVYVKANFISEEEYLNVNYHQLPTKHQVEVYPNPFNNELYILAPSYEYGYSLYTMEGKEIQTGKLMNSKLEFDNLPKGMYVLRLYSDHDMLTKQIIKK